MAGSTSAQYSLTIRVEIDHRPGMLGRVASAIGDAGGTIGSVDLVSLEGGHTLRDITVDTAGDEHGAQIVAAIDGVDGATVIDSTDRTLRMHVGGKIEQRNKHPLKTRDDLSMAYTPGVARVCMAIHADRDKAFQFTIKRNTVAVVSDGSAVLGLGDIGPEASMPVMEGKCMLFKEFAGIDAFPIVLNTNDPDAIVATVEAISPGFGGINLEDISAPRCFEIEDRLKASLDIPVFHDDQHGTAVVTLAALLNAVKITGKRLEDLNVLIVGLGAAGVAVGKIFREAGVGNQIVCDSRGALHTQRADYLDGSMPDIKRWFAEETNPERPHRRARRRDRGRRPLRRPLRRARDAAGGARAHERRRDGVRDGQPEPGGHAGGGRALRAHHRHGPLGLPEPDQQRALLPGRSSAARSTSAPATSPRR